jgi:uncharacterized protein YndB with AHSA1/START domain
MAAGSISYRRPAGFSGRRLRKAVEVPASQVEVWKAWTTKEGLRAFLAPDARISLEIGGPFEPLFDLETAPGSQGGEGLQILSYLPPEMLSFTWNAPPEFPTIRNHFHTWVVVRLIPLGADRTRVALDHLGWGSGEKWDKVYNYFDRAWDLVLARLAHRFANGPINWSDPYRPPKDWTATVRE